MLSHKNILYRDLLLNLIIKKIKEKYIHSYLGLAWNFLYPFLMLSVYMTILGLLFKRTLDPQLGTLGYFAYFSCGFFPWLFFEENLKTTSDSLIENFNVIKKVIIPMEIFPFSYTLVTFLNLSINILFLVIFFMFFKPLPLSTLLTVSTVLFFFFHFTLGLVFIFSAITIIVRDLKPILYLLLFILFWITPIAYPETLIPSSYLWILKLNPIYYFIKPIQQSFLQGSSLSWPSFTTIFLLSFCSLTLGWFVLRELKNQLYDLL